MLIEVRSKKPDVEWQLMQAILGFLDRHFSDNIRTILIHYESEVSLCRLTR